MSQSSSSEITFTPDHSGDDTIKRVKKITILLSVVTLIELGLGLLMYKMGGGSTFTILLIKGVVVILSLAKAFYITSVFMHLGDEVRNMIMTIVVPLCLFIWFIGAFIWDGDSWKNLRNRYDRQKAPTEQAAPAVHKNAEK